MSVSRETDQHQRQNSTNDRREIKFAAENRGHATEGDAKLSGNNRKEFLHAQIHQLIEQPYQAKSRSKRVPHSTQLALNRSQRNAAAKSIEPGDAPQGAKSNTPKKDQIPGPV